MRHLDLFSGIGLFSYAADHVWSLEHVFCEIDEWLRKYLRQEYPDATIEKEIRKFDGAKYRGSTFLLTAGVPCQPSSVAGKREGTADDRWLWPEAIRVMGEAQPEWAIFENPYGILTLERGMVFETLVYEMESQGYSIQSYLVPACAVGTTHERQRVWIVAHADSIGCQYEQEEKQKSFYDKNRTSPISKQQREFKQCGISESNKIPSSFANASITRSRELSQSEKWDEKINIERSNCETSNSNGERLSWHTQTEFKGVQKSDESFKRSKLGGISSEDLDYWQRPWPEVAADLCGVDVPSPDRTHRIKVLGGTIQWEIAMIIMQGIKAVEDGYK